MEAEKRAGRFPGKTPSLEKSWACERNSKKSCNRRDPTNTVENPLEFCVGIIVIECESLTQIQTIPEFGLFFLFLVRVFFIIIMMIPSDVSGCSCVHIWKWFFFFSSCTTIPMAAAHGIFHTYEPLLAASSLLFLALVIRFSFFSPVFNFTTNERRRRCVLRVRRALKCGRRQAMASRGEAAKRSDRKNEKWEKRRERERCFPF